MSQKIERSIDELYSADPERADAIVFGRTARPDRRGFLGGAGLAAMGAAVGGAIPFSANMPAGLAPAALAQTSTEPAPKPPEPFRFPGKDERLTVLGDRPLVAETPEHLLDDDTTPLNKFFVRNNGQIPEAATNADAWTIAIDGEVNNPLSLTVGELKKRFKMVTYRTVLECGGNGRAFFQPTARGNQWTNGGAGCAEWTGIPLSEVLRAAGLKDSARYTGHLGADPHLSGDAKLASISRGMPIPKALEQHTLIAFAMNGEPLTNIHGGPVRLIVPGWPGSLSHKWLTRIWIRDREHDGAGMGGTSYRVPIRPMIPGERQRIPISRYLNPCRCAGLSQIPQTAPGSQPARGRSIFGAQRGTVITESPGWTCRSISARPGRRRKRLRRRTDMTGCAGRRQSTCR